MNVKCPKCRFRFETYASPGMIELQCNCPRCGIPFTYVVPEEGGVTTSTTSKDGVAGEDKSLATTVGEDTNRHNVSAHVIHREDDVSGAVSSSVLPLRTMPPSPHVLSHREGILKHAAPPTSPQDHSKRYGYLKGCAVVFTIMLLTFVFFIYRCESSKSYTADSLEIRENGNATYGEGAAGYQVPPFDKHAPAQTAPSWIQGRWHVETDYGGITVIIHKKNITEISGGQMSHGQFEYQNHTLYCNFGDKTIFVYRLLEDKRQIDAGDGLLMQKTE